MITGIHAILYSKDADRVRAFFRDVLDLPSVDAGHGWLIFGLPPAEAAAHPTEGREYAELYLMCDDLAACMEKMQAKGVRFTQPVSNQGWGALTRFELPGFGEMGLYQPRHPTAIGPRS